LKKTITILFCTVFCCLNALSQENILEKRISVHSNGAGIKRIVEMISMKDRISFSYRSNIPDLNRKAIIHKDNAMLKDVLKELFKGTHISYIAYGKQIILVEKKKVLQRRIIKGIIISAETGEPLPYAAVANISAGKGVIADVNGRFEYPADKENLSDTIRFTCLGFQKSDVTIEQLTEKERLQIILRPKEIYINSISISGKKFYSKKNGNRGFIPSGSLYIDTHGQQTALFIEPKEKKEGILLKVGFRLSGKGNPNAPFRIRIYELDTITGKPGRDLIPDIIVVKPNVQRGWYYADISQYGIPLPQNGFFASMEGVYPNDFDFGQTGFVDLSEQGYVDPILSLSYGQRLSYNRKGKNNTWHYSLSHTWFQIEKRNFNAMIAVVIDYKKD